MHAHSVHHSDDDVEEKKPSHHEHKHEEKEELIESKPKDMPVKEFVAPKASNAPIFVNLQAPPDFVPHVNQDAGILTPTIQLPESGDAFLDEESMHTLSKELVKYVNKASEEYKFDRKDLIWIGHSNGANMIASVMMFYPTVIEKAVLLRPNYTIAPSQLPSFADVFVLISVGRQDETVPQENTEKLIRIFQHSGAVVELFQHDATHELTDADIVAVQKWLLRQH